MKDWQTAQPPLNPLDPTPLNYFSFFFSRINVVLSFSFHFTYILSAFVKAAFWDGHLIFIVLLINSLFYSSSIRYFCGYSLISHNFKIVDSINFKLVAFICIFFFWHMQTMFSSVVRISGLCLLPNRSMKYNLFSLYLSFTKELFPLHLGHHYCQAGYDSEDVIWKKSTEKKRFPLPHQQRPTLFYQLWFTNT